MGITSCLAETDVHRAVERLMVVVINEDISLQRETYDSNKPPSPIMDPFPSLPPTSM